MPASREAPRASVISGFNGLAVPGMYLLSAFKKKQQLCFVPHKFAKFPAFPETYFTAQQAESTSREGRACSARESSEEREHHREQQTPVMVSTSTWQEENAAAQN